jgi:hypothetical protein
MFRKANQYAVRKKKKFIMNVGKKSAVMPTSHYKRGPADIEGSMGHR